MFIIAVPTPPVIAAPSYSRRLRTNKSHFFHFSSYHFVFRARSLFNFGCRSFNPVKFLQVSSRRNRPRRLSGIPWGPESSDLDSSNGTLKDSNHGWLCLAPRVQSLSDNRLHWGYRLVLAYDMEETPQGFQFIHFTSLHGHQQTGPLIHTTCVKC